MSFLQTYDPLGSPLLSTLLAALPLLLLIYLLAAHPWHDREGRRQRGIGAPRAAFIASLVSLAMAVLVLGMPFPAAGASLVYGALSGLFPIGWVLVAAMFLYTLTVVTGQFDVVRESIVAVSADRRIQVLIIAFALGSFLEGAAGFGIPVAIAGAMMVGLGFRPFQAAVLNLLANSVPVAFGAIGTPVLTLGAVTNLDPNRLGALSALQLAPFCLVTPFLVITVMVKMDRKPFRKVLEVWPALLVSGVTFTLGEYLTAAYLGPGLVGILGGLVTLVALLALLTVWRPAAPYDGDPIAASAPARRLAPMAGGAGSSGRTRAAVVRAWLPWVLLTLFVFLWGQPAVKAALERPVAGIPTVLRWSVPFLDQAVYRMPPVVAEPTAEPAVYTLNWLSSPGTAIFLAALVAGLCLGTTPAQWKETVVRTAQRMRGPLTTVAMVLGFSYLTRYTGADGILGLAFTRTGWLYPFFAPLLGWIGVFITGSDTSANAMFGSLQQITARQLGLDEYLIVSANSVGGCTGKLLSAQSIVVATAATYEDRQEAAGAVGSILRAVAGYSLAMAVISGLIVMALAYLAPGLIH
ncbi:L-lactate permease [Symbiobacterium thermophilum]|uniref:L-lactate permease n=1 Tax=Symbiobacterium thermophilum (strain DSM 24528 / JCM 14929 / IAM 14863 / T) TaxID=292459 RepID=Q67TB2_SYMTH|nr:L-lactate permease [Symbiobacterium thermophilum]BAD39081.1 L-lactate permease [Symbiobacterium thermophilum IAM 14863]